MPIKQEIYICKVCGAKFDKEEDAKFCENRHPDMVDCEVKYEPYKKYPTRLRVYYDNRKYVDYVEFNEVL